MNLPPCSASCAKPKGHFYIFIWFNLSAKMTQLTTPSLKKGASKASRTPSSACSPPSYLPGFPSTGSSCAQIWGAEGLQTELWTSHRLPATPLWSRHRLHGGKSHLLANNAYMFISSFHSKSKQPTAPWCHNVYVLQHLRFNRYKRELLISPHNQNKKENSNNREGVLVSSGSQQSSVIQSPCLAFSISSARFWCTRDFFLIQFWPPTVRERFSLSVQTHSGGNASLIERWLKPLLPFRGPLRGHLWWGTDDRAEHGQHQGVVAPQNGLIPELPTSGRPSKVCNKLLIVRGFLLVLDYFQASQVALVVICQCRRRKRRGCNAQIGKIPWSRAWQPTPVFFPGESHGQRSLAGYSPRGRKESDAAWHTMALCYFKSKAIWQTHPFSN